MFYVSGRLRGVFYVVWRLREFHLYVFYVSGRLPGGTHSGDLCERVGPLEKDLTRAGGGEGGGGAEWLICTCFTCPGGSERVICKYLSILEALGGSFVRVLRVLEVLGGSFVRILRIREGRP